MQLAQDGLAPFVLAAPIQDSEIELVMNVPGCAVQSVDEIRRYLISQVTQSIRWEQGISSIQGIDTYIEIGCGKTLTGLNRKIGVEGFSQSIDKVTDLDLINERYR
jgi:[acyl-carrier-protein] S-malonyltransferase